MLCTPIFIHSFVVFVRLYWFERRFQNIVKEARSKSRSRTKIEPEDEPDSSVAEKGVRGRSIVVLHSSQAPQEADATEDSPTTSDSSRTQKLQDQPIPFHRNITFADEVQKQDRDELVPPMIPQQLSLEQHIAIREKQRNQKAEGALRIPGPRDFDRGSVPEPLDTELGGREVIHQSPWSNDVRVAGGISNGIPTKRNITMNEPEHATFPKTSNQKSDMNDLLDAPTEELAPQSAGLRARTGTFSSMRNWASKENEPATPYLSWQATIGRNSAFVDLTEEQREELGGIEYRSLKTLAIVLVCTLPRYLEITVAGRLLTGTCSLLCALPPARCHHPSAVDHSDFALEWCRTE